MEMTSKDDFSRNMSTVRRGHYGLVHTDLKLQILRELVDEAIETTAVKEKLEEQIDQKQALAAAKREIVRKNKEEQKLNMEGATEKEVNHTNSVPDGNKSVNGQIDQQQALAAAKSEIARKNKEEQKLNMEGATEKEMNHISSVPDGNESVNGQLMAKEREERKNAPARKMEDGKLYLVGTYINIPFKCYNPCELLYRPVNSYICTCMSLKLFMTVLLFAYFFVEEAS